MASIDPLMSPSAGVLAADWEQTHPQNPGSSPSPGGQASPATGNGARAPSPIAGDGTDVTTSTRDTLEQMQPVQSSTALFGLSGAALLALGLGIGVAMGMLMSVAIMAVCKHHASRQAAAAGANPKKGKFAIRIQKAPSTVITQTSSVSDLVDLKNALDRFEADQKVAGNQV